MARVRFRLLSVLVVIVATVVACLSACSSRGLDYFHTVVDGQESVGISKRDTAVRGVVIFFHGLDRDESVLSSDTAHKDMTATLTDAGYAVVASRGGGNAYGSAASQHNYAELVFGAAKHYASDRIFFLAESMGTIAAVNLMAKNKDIPVLGLAAINPLLNLGALTPQYVSAAQYANPDEPIVDVDPLSLSIASLAGEHLRVYVSPGDTLISTADNATAFENRFGAVANISVVTCSGEHMDPSCIQGEDISEWFSSLGPH
jgi:pimeloyl-ACP methyl ester carboxylesterase